MTFNVEQWAADHEKLDQQRFTAINERLDQLPVAIKKTVNGSVEDTVDHAMWNFLKWIGVGGFITIASMAAWWGALANQVHNDQKKLEDVLTTKDLSSIQAQLSQIQADIRALK